MSDLTAEGRASLGKYHIALRQFLSVAPAPLKSNPTRAAKAREKLLKLSASQFFELSTDVYDELQRRISESQEEPDFLLPMESFHPKRNEAREKLGSLQQIRFRDLVSDIFFEIDRRNKLMSNGSTPSDGSNNRVSTNTILTNASGETGTVNRDRGSLDDGKKQGVGTLQQTTVIPTKADMAWSSDEEDQEPLVGRRNTNEITNQSHQSPASVPRATTSVVSSQSPLSSSNRTSRASGYSPTAFRHVPSVVSHESPRLIPAKRLSNGSQNSESSARDTVGDMNGFSANEPRVQRGLSINKNRNKDREIELLIQEGTKMDSKITDLEQKNNLLLTKADKFEQEVTTLQTLKDNLTSKIEKLELQLSESQAQVSTLQSDLRTRDSRIGSLQSELQQVQLAKPSIGTRDLNNTPVDVPDSVWKEKYMEIKEFHQRETPSVSTISDESIEKFISPLGVIPISLVVKLRQEIEAYLLSLSAVANSQAAKSVLFENIGLITDTANKIVCRVPQSDKAEMVRAALSHAITSTRYFSIYLELLPKLVVESAVSQVAFSVFELVQDVKLTRDSHSSNNYAPSSTDLPNPKSVNGDADVSPVRPLRMAKKIDSPGYTSTPRSVSTTATPKPLNLTINSQLSNSNQPTDNKSGSSGFHSTLRSVSTTTASKPLNLTINSQLANGPQHTTKTPLTYPLKDSTLTSKSIVDNDLGSNTPPQVSPITTRYSPEDTKAQSSPPPTTGLRKSSSSNILSKVKQFEQQAGTTPTSSPSSRKPVVSPLSENAIGMFGKRKVSEPTVNTRALMDAVPTLTGAATSVKEAPVDDDVSGSVGLTSDTSVSQKYPEGNIGDSVSSPIEVITSAETSPVRSLVPEASDSTHDLNSGSIKGDVADGESHPLPTSSEFAKKDVDPEAATVKPKSSSAAITSTTVGNVLKDGLKEQVGDQRHDDADDQYSSSGDEDYDAKQADEDNFDVDDFDIEDPDNTLSELLLYLEHQTVKVISTIQALLTSIKTADSTKGQLRSGSKDISDVVSQMVDATSNSMNQSRNAQLKEHGRWVVDSLADSKRRMNTLCLKSNDDEDDDNEYADKQFKQRLAGIAFDVAKCTKELVKSVEEANLKDEIAHLNARLVR